MNRARLRMIRQCHHSPGYRRQTLRVRARQSAPRPQRRPRGTLAAIEAAALERIAQARAMTRRGSPTRVPTAINPDATLVGPHSDKGPAPNYKYGFAVHGLSATQKWSKEGSWYHDIVLLDRTEERATLSEVVEAVSSGRSRVLVLAGEPGMGKTSLLKEAVASAVTGNVGGARPPL
jgi:AAA ATPase domain